MYEGDLSLLEEIEEQDFDAVVGGSFYTYSRCLSCWLGNRGRFCTLTKECQPSCN